MSSRTNPISRFAETAKEKVAPSTTSSTKAKDPTENWSPEEMFETTLDKDGNPVPEPYSFIDGERMTRGTKGGNDEGDVYAAANDDFD
ncbi:uncharacterized protein BO80DRAFT_426495 [Aspergillus ibericus CBS 121593]|uniref:Uncharacterized protein n=1 Tax=Aspergillus ibericus CBS 121593 TaxID=1448316 RepID=A0A395GVB8_9EURO|nr:hypothetical protein BO80DRAFT_426495 [Aspergillus ibericus CBS 121593]RAK99510.1 hypothetical protein BO80DRAFT_426495 [Aspergillus ibericus CBS 121593]